jgi:hypothetical protein
MVPGSGQLQVVQVALHGDGALSGGLRPSWGDGLPIADHLRLDANRIAKGKYLPSFLLALRIAWSRNRSLTDRHLRPGGQHTD